jgi:hypothetical protein
MKRLFFIGVLPLLLSGCATVMQPDVKVSINSDKVLGVKDFEYTPATEYSSCNVTGAIEYDIAVEPKNFTGIIYFKGMKVRYADTWTAEEDNQATFVDGKQVYGISIGQFAYAEDSKAKKEALCSSKSSSDIKLISLGEALFATPGVNATNLDKK